MNIVLGVAGSVLMYELCRIHMQLVGNEKCGKSMQILYNTIKECPHCSKALHDLSGECNMTNDFVPRAETSQNHNNNTTKEYDACENQNQSSSVYHTMNAEINNNGNGAEYCFDACRTSTPTNTEDSRIIVTGKITKNPFLNYCREHRAKRLGQQQKIIVKESASKWKQLTKCDRMNYSFSAVNLRESHNKNSHSINQNKTN